MDIKGVRKFVVAALVVVFLAVSAVQPGPALGQSPAISASSTSNGRIAFVSNRDGNSEIYVMNADGSGQANLTNDSAEDSNPSFSPDGSKIAFVSTRDGSDEIYVMDASGSQVVRLTEPTYGVQSLWPSWSPDGTRIVFASNRGVSWDIYVMDANDGNGVVQLTANTPLVFSERPNWSPDGSKIAFTIKDYSGGGNPRGEIYVMDANGSNPTKLTNNPAYYNIDPSWSPDGEKIVFESYRDGNSEIYVMNADGTGQTRLTDNEGVDDRDPCWSPEQTWIGFASTRDGSAYEIYVMNADGTGQTRLINNLANDQQPSWGLGQEVLPTATPDGGDIRLPVPVPTLRQNDSLWATDVYDGYLPEETSETIAVWGCAVTSAAMVLNYYGTSFGVQTTPKELDDWLAANSGYTPEHGVIWTRIPWFAWERMGLTLAQPVYVQTTVGRLDSALTLGNPPIVNVGGHFVVVTGKVGGKYTINDPLAGGLETLDQYPSWGSMIVYSSASGPTAPSVWLYLCSPAELLVTDGQGRRIGIDPTTGTEFSEIPGAFYGDEFLSPDDSGGATMHAKVLTLPDGGTYTVEVIGTGDGIYTLLTISSGSNGQPLSQSITRSVTPGQVDDYVLEYSPADGVMDLLQQTYLPLVVR